ncbi:hypothetical protein [Microbacterium paludicola]|uniref:hypothetical protein n=1 Tax=Microbacterium paludicola TaxID=300019 RepID=UPI00286B97EA|nr:hypothetical protein [Microbacterium paludicola]
MLSTVTVRETVVSPSVAATTAAPSAPAVGVPGSRERGERIVGQREARLVVVELPGGGSRLGDAVAHPQDCGRIVVAEGRERPAVGEHQAQGADLEVVVVLGEVDLGRLLRTRPHAHDELVTADDVLERHGRDDRLPSLRADLEDVEDIVTDAHAVLEVVIDVRRVEDETRLVLEGGGGLHGRAVDRQLDRARVRVAPGDDLRRSRDEPPVLEIESDRVGVDPGHRNATSLRRRGVRAVARGDRVFVPALADEVGGVDHERHRSVARVEEVDARRSGIDVVGELQRHGPRQDVIGHGRGDREVGARLDLGGGAVDDRRRLRVGRHDHQTAGNLVWLHGTRRRRGEVDDPLRRDIRSDGVTDPLVGDGVIGAVEVV